MKAIVLSAALAAGAASAAPVTATLNAADLPKWEAVGASHDAKFGGLIFEGSSVTIRATDVRNYFVSWAYGTGSFIGFVYQTQAGIADAYLEITASYWNSAQDDATFHLPGTNGVSWNWVIQAEPWRYFDSITFTARNGAAGLGAITFEVPEPSPVALIGAGLAGLIWARRRRDTRPQ